MDKVLCLISEHKTRYFAAVEKTRSLVVSKIVKLPFVVSKINKVQENTNKKDFDS